MAEGDLGILAEAQRETVRALATLTERLGPQVAQDQLPAPRIERVLTSTTQAVSELGSATTANSQAVSGLVRELGGLPALVAGLVGGDKGGGSALGSVLRSGLGLVPLGLKIAGLFRGGGADEKAAAPAQYMPPPSLALEVANTESMAAGFTRVERGEGGRPRVVEPEKTMMMQPQVTVNVSAMDSRSFLDRSEDIARAVRDAMLHMHPVNDFISEL